MKVQLTWTDPFGAEETNILVFASERDMLIEVQILACLGCKNIVYTFL